MAWTDFFTGTDNQIKQYNKYNPQQMNQMNQVGQQGFQGLQNLNTSFEPIAQRAREQFGQVGIPSISERFTKSGGGQRSSAFGQSIGQGGADLEAQLAGLQSQHNLGQQDFFKSLLGIGLQPQFENYLEKGNTGLFGHLGNALPSFAQGLGNGIGGLGGIGNLFSMFNQQNQQDNGNSGEAVKSQYSPEPLNANSFNRPMNSSNPSLMNMLQMLSMQRR